MSSIPNSSTEFYKTIKCVCLGDRLIGKSSLVHRICTDQPFKEHSFHFKESRIKEMKIEDKLIECEIWDSPHWRKFQTISEIEFYSQVKVLWILFLFYRKISLSVLVQLVLFYSPCFLVAELQLFVQQLWY